jgi:hypothetical protein
MDAISHTEVVHIHSDASPRQWVVKTFPTLRDIGLSEIFNITRNPIPIDLLVQYIS